MVDQLRTEDDDVQQPGQHEPGTAGDPREDNNSTGTADELSFPLVGVGASAGGLQAFETLLKHLPSDSGMAMVFVQHLSPDHASNLTEILPRSTAMTVQEAGDGMQIEQNHLYVIPPNRDLAVMGGVLQLMTRSQTPARHMPVDYLFRSLAEDQGNRAVGVVLSGTGSDGAAGLRAIKAEGGVTLAQDEKSARYSGMPHAAAATGQVDLILSPSDIAQELARIVQHPHIRREPATRKATGLGAPSALQKVFVLIRQATGVDFSQYKQSTVERRIARRMVLHKLDSPQRYLSYLQQTPREVQALFEDMLISVTSFFREPATFEALKQKVFPHIVPEKNLETPVRVWVPGCSTGEEAYSIGIVLAEYLKENDLQRSIQIFATDIGEAFIEKARHGYYPDNIAGDVSEERLKRYFVRSGESYRVSKAIRDLCVFARQNVIKDPPFSNLDLLSCRNLLIYLGSNLQKRVVPTFHYALKPSGYLLLGQSETIGGFSDLFSLVDREQKVHAKKSATTHLPPDIGKPEPAAPPAEDTASERPAGTRARDLEREADRLLAERFAPPGVIVGPDMQILHFHGETSPFLEHAPGAASLSLLGMVKPGLGLDVRTAMHEARKEHRCVRREAIQTSDDEGNMTMNVEVHPLGKDADEDNHLVVLFHRTPAAAKDREMGEESEPRSAAEAANKQEADRLRRELRETKTAMQSIIEEHEGTNEELRAANEEIQSANEELQSVNEELETAKEELQSTNEELTTLNSELENQNAEANRAIDDFNNLHRSVDIPVILLDNELTIRTYTPPAESKLGVRPTDKGRRIGELRLGLQVNDLESRIREVLASLNTYRDEVRSEAGAWYSLQIRPFRTADDRITGAVIALVDITEIRHAQQQEYGRVLAEGIVRTVPQPLIILDSELRVVMANPALYRTFQMADRATEGYKVYELGSGQWDNAELRRLLEHIVPQNTEFQGFELVQDFPNLGRKRLVLDAQRIAQEGEFPNLVLLSIREINDA